MTREEIIYIAQLKNKKTNVYENITNQLESKSLCFNYAAEYIKTYREINHDLYYWDSLRVIKKVKEISGKTIDEVVFFGEDEGFREINNIHKQNICRQFGVERLNNLINKYNFKTFKYLAEPLWGLSYPILDHYILFRDGNKKEYLISNTYFEKEEIEKEMNNHPDIEYEILDPEYRYLYTTNLIVFSKKREKQMDAAFRRNVISLRKFKWLKY